MPEPLHVNVEDRTGRLPVKALTWIRDTLHTCGQHLRGEGDVRVMVVDDKTMQNNHLEFLNIDETTDVITFDLTDEVENIRPITTANNENSTDITWNKFVFDTDIYVCLDEALRQATDREYPVERELVLYGLHGMLHCLGFDDHDAGQAARMHRMEDEVLRAVGVGAVYRDGSPDASSGS